MVDLASTVWRPTGGVGEAGQSDDAIITTQSGVSIAAQDGIELQIQPASYTRLDPTEWEESEGE